MNTKVTSVTEAEIQSATAALAKLRRQMPFIVTLTPPERMAARSVTEKKVLDTQTRAVLARQHSDGLPPSFDLAAFEREVAFLTALQGWLATVTQLQSDLRDTFLAVGTRAVQTGKVAFGHLQVMAGASGDISQALRQTKIRAQKTKQEARAASEAPSASASAPAGPGNSSATPAPSGSAPPAGPEPPLTIPSAPTEPGDGGKGTTNKAA
jgi:hypothetical protein